MEWLCMMAAHVLLGSLWPGSTIDLHRVRHRKLGKTANSVWRQRGAVDLGPTTARTGLIGMASTNYAGFQNKDACHETAG